MNIEVAPKEYEVTANWDEAIMYCFTLGNNWRLPTNQEMDYLIKNRNGYELVGRYWTSTKVSMAGRMYSWYYNGNTHTASPSEFSPDIVSMLVRPVRDI